MTTKNATRIILNNKEAVVLSPTCITWCPQMKTTECWMCTRSSVMYIQYSI